MTRKMPDLSNAYVIAAFLDHLVDTPVSVAAIRQWAKRGHITRRGTGSNGLALYDPQEVLAVARRSAERGACTSGTRVSQ